MKKAIYNAILSLFSADARENAAAAFVSLYIHTDATNTYTVGFVRDGMVYSATITPNEYRNFLHWNTTSCKNGAEGEREPRLRCRIPKKAVFSDAMPLCTEAALIEATQTGKNRGEAFEEMLTGKPKDANTPYYIAPDSDILGSIKISEATSCTLSALASALAYFSSSKIKMILYTAWDLPIKYASLLAIIAECKEALERDADYARIEIPRTVGEMLAKYDGQYTTETRFIRDAIIENGYISKGIERARIDTRDSTKDRYFLKFSKPFAYMP